MHKTVFTYSFEGQEDAGHFSFDEEICAHVLEHFKVRINDLLNEL